MSLFSHRSASVSPTPGKGTCPHLGIPDDPQTCLAFPSEWNLCYRAKPVSAVSLGQQRKTCLLPVYTRCPVFLRERAGPLPSKLRGARATSWSRRVVLIVLMLILVFGLWVIWQYMETGTFPVLESIPRLVTTRSAILPFSKC